MTTNRLERIETDLETVKELLVSTARYAESANSTLDRLSQRMDDHAVESQRLERQLTQRMDGLAQRMDELAQQQAQTAARLDEFIYQSQRLLTQNAERMIQHEGRLERLDGVMAMLSRLQDRQQAQLENQQSQMAHQQAQIERMDRDYEEHRRTTNAALERIDRLLDYLIRRDQENS
jgi:methyl-accepting chemotaxis protein